MDDVMGRRVDKSVLITASPAVMHGKVVRIMDLAKRHGANNLVKKLAQYGVASAAITPAHTPLKIE